MKEIRLGKTGITVPQNGFGCLPVQRISRPEAVHLLQKAWSGGMRFFDTARAYSDSEEKVGAAFRDIERSQFFLATKTMAKTPEAFEKDLAQSLENLQTDYVDLYQFHCADCVWRPGDGSGMYEAMLKAKSEGKIRHIGITAHKLGVAREAVESGLYETLQYPFSYLSSAEELALPALCQAHDMGLIAMKGLAGGLLSNADACMGFMSQYDNVLPIWGIQKEQELDDWLAFFDREPEFDEKTRAFVEKEQEELAGDFCRGCGYCMPCPQGIVINQCARMSLMLRRAPSASWLSEDWQKEMEKIETCLHCGKCASRCPYSLDTPALLEKNLEDYRSVLAGKERV